LYGSGVYCSNKKNLLRCSRFCDIQNPIYSGQSVYKKSVAYIETIKTQESFPSSLGLFFILHKLKMDSPCAGVGGFDPLYGIKDLELLIFLVGGLTRASAINACLAREVYKSQINHITNL
jgi:hypothetical protein